MSVNNIQRKTVPVIMNGNSQAIYRFPKVIPISNFNFTLEMKDSADNNYVWDKTEYLGTNTIVFDIPASTIDLPENSLLIGALKRDGEEMIEVHFRTSNQL